MSYRLSGLGIDGTFVPANANVRKSPPAFVYRRDDIDVFNRQDPNYISRNWAGRFVALTEPDVAPNGTWSFREWAWNDQGQLVQEGSASGVRPFRLPPSLHSIPRPLNPQTPEAAQFERNYAQFERTYMIVASVGLLAAVSAGVWSLTRRKSPTPNRRRR